MQTPVLCQLSFLAKQIKLTDQNKFSCSHLTQPTFIMLFVLVVGLNYLLK